MGPPQSLQPGPQKPENFKTLDLSCSLQRQFLSEQERTGALCVKPPTPPRKKASLKETHGLPSHLARIQSDPEAAMALTFSRQLWANAVPGTPVRLASVLTVDVIIANAAGHVDSAQVTQRRELSAAYPTAHDIPPGREKRVAQATLCVTAPRS